MAKPTIAELQLRIDLQGMGKLAQLTQALNRVGGAAIRRQLDAQAKALLGIEDASKKAGKSTSAFGNFLKTASRLTIVSQGVYRGFKMVGGAIASSLEPLADFEHNMARVRAKGQLSASEAKAASEAVKAMTGMTQYGPVEMSTAAVGLAAAGKGKTLAADLPTMLRFAQANDVDPEKATEILLGTSGQFGMKGSADLNRIGNMITKADQMSVLNVSQIYDTLKYVGPLAKDAKLPLEAVLSMIVSLGDAGIVASKGGTGLRNLLSAIAAPPRRAKEAQKKLDIIHLTHADLQAGFGDIPAFLKDLESRFEKYNVTPAERMAINKTLFGQYGMTATSALMGDSTETINGQTNIQNYRTELKKTGDLMKEQADLMGGTFKNRLQQVNAEWELMQINIGEMNLPQVNEAVDTLLKFMRGDVGKQAAESFGTLTTLLLTALPPAVGVFSASVSGFAQYLKDQDAFWKWGIFKDSASGFTGTKEVQDEAKQEQFVREAAERVQEAKNRARGYVKDAQYMTPTEAGNIAVAEHRRKEAERKRAELLAGMTPEERERFLREEEHTKRGTKEGILLPPGVPQHEPVKPHVPGELYVMVELSDDLKAKLKAKQGEGEGFPMMSVGLTSQ